ncbi:peptidase inhibitor family I36 protein [Phycicoccus sp. CSK15P-2]|uniref:peptidase inhibitor family I36 protein n=1 Tax=Phycicoccus sp. CSK15P-2 TaxID=2807627 RepID=UPI00195225FA|nr:peptidase inhibitor family I36 protein [Phycicoccus sp. CSK15P-2]MBM6406066.1 peptidase inhibitor family I36 protein [Phycicoccus sp. CSK15P-2]
MRNRQVTTLLTTGVTAALAAATLATAPAASAATARNGVCEKGEFCLYYNSGNQGSLVDMKNSQSNYRTGANCITYISRGAGQGNCVKNDAASAWNRTGRIVTVFHKSGYKGSIDAMMPGTKTDLNANLKNDNAGHLIGTEGNTPMPKALYQAGGGRISAWFDGYRNTPGRHEGIDMVRGYGSPVHALMNGFVTNTDGGGGGLSTLAIYNRNFDKTVVYLHLAPANLRVGDYVTRGQRIGTEADRGAPTHTHVELRNGRQTHAAKSVNDPRLDNPVPTTFWRARGYHAAFE